MVTSSPMMLSQKSKPYSSGCSSGFATETREALFGTPKMPPSSRLENELVGGERVSLPMTRGSTSLPEEVTVILAGEVSSVR